MGAHRLIVQSPLPGTRGDNPRLASFLPGTRANAGWPTAGWPWPSRTSANSAWVAARNQSDLLGPHTPTRRTQTLSPLFPDCRQRAIDRRFKCSRLQAQPSIDAFHFQHHKTRHQAKPRILRLSSSEDCERQQSGTVAASPELTWNARRLHLVPIPPRCIALLTKRACLCGECENMALKQGYCASFAQAGPRQHPL
jgi:hypothetical protein